jgi:hypothetical protein
MARRDLLSFGITVVLLLPAATTPTAGVARVSTGKTSVTAREIEEMLASQPAPRVVDVLMRTDGQGRTVLWDFVVGKIETADVEWLKVALLLSPGKDGAVGEDLAAAEAEAMPRAPTLVLALFGPDVCFIPDTTWPDSVSAYRRELVRRQRSVGAVGEPTLKKQRGQCLKAYVDDSKYAEEYYAKK